jgi:hypothetical protein
MARALALVVAPAEPARPPFRGLVGCADSNLRRLGAALLLAAVFYTWLVRLPAVSHGVASFLWAVGLGFYVWLFSEGVGMSRAFSVVTAAVSACAIFLLVRVYGEDEPRRP